MLWSREGKPLQTINGHSARVNSVSFSPDSKTIATASFDETAKLGALGKELKTLKGHSARVNRVSFSRMVRQLPLPVLTIPSNSGAVTASYSKL
jgi:WD40 repeat protein